MTKSAPLAPGRGQIMLLALALPGCALLAILFLLASLLSSQLLILSAIFAALAGLSFFNLKKLMRVERQLQAAFIARANSQHGMAFSAGMSFGLFDEQMVLIEPTQQKLLLAARSGTRTRLIDFRQLIRAEFITRTRDRTRTYRIRLIIDDLEQPELLVPFLNDKAAADLAYSRLTVILQRR